jgi:hypothetical protein
MAVETQTSGCCKFCWSVSHTAREQAAQRETVQGQKKDAPELTQQRQGEADETTGRGADSELLDDLLELKPEARYWYGGCVQQGYYAEYTAYGGVCHYKYVYRVLNKASGIGLVWGSGIRYRR